MRRRDFLKAAGMGGCVLASGGLRPRGPVRAAPAEATPANRRRPNILFIMVDDLGKEWISCCGAQEIKTPRIDRLAAEGMRLTCAYSMAQCTPTRVTLLTGQYPFRTGWVNHWDVPRWGVGYFDWRRHTTFARILKGAGYATAAAGKWQINDFRLVPDAMGKHGFDEWCMWTGGEGGNPASSKRYWDAYIHTGRTSRTHEGKFGPDVFTDFLIGFMKRHKAEPMLLYFPMALTHGPLVHTPDELDAKSKLDKHKAMVRYTDKLVGRLVDAIRALGLQNDTIVFFTTDNGSSGGITGRRSGRKVRGGKAKKTEAGVCCPFIAWGPTRVPAGKVSGALTDFTDLPATFAELAGAEMPKDARTDGVSIAPVLLGKAEKSARHWILAMGHGAARLDAKGVRGRHDYASRVLRDERFKVWVDESRRITRLHDLRADPWEEKNLLDSADPACRAALAKFGKVVASLPSEDARPQYAPRKANPWDRKAGTGRRRRRR